MRNDSRRAIQGLAIALLASAGIRCANSDVLSPAPAQLNLEVHTSPAGSPKYEAGAVNLAHVLFRPLDPAADAALGGQPYSLVASPRRLDLTSPAPILIASIGVSPGVYRVVGVRLQGPSAQDFDFFAPPFPPVTTCLDGVLARDGVQGALPPPEILPSSVNVSVDVTFSPEPTFQVVGGEQTTLTLTIDGTSFFPIFEAAFVCRSSGTCNRGNQVFPAPCMAGYIPPTPDQIRPLLSFQ